MEFKEGQEEKFIRDADLDEFICLNGCNIGDYRGFEVFFYEGVVIVVCRDCRKIYGVKK